MEAIMAIPAIYWALGAVGILVFVFVAKFLWALAQTIFKAVILIAMCAVVVGICFFGFKAYEKVGDAKREVSSFVNEKTDSVKDLTNKFNR